MQKLDEVATEIECLVNEWWGRLCAISERFAHRKPSSDRWSISEVVGHLIDSACNNHQRFIRAQNCESLVFPKYDQNHWVAAGHYRSCHWESLVALWYHYNCLLAVTIRNIPVDRLATGCTISPYPECTLEFLVTDYCDHLKHHLGILTERIRSADDDV